jgi:hypothetical protein
VCGNPPILCQKLNVDRGVRQKPTDASDERSRIGDVYDRSVVAWANAQAEDGVMFDQRVTRRPTSFGSMRIGH